MYWKGEAPLGSPAGAGDSIPKCAPPHMPRWLVTQSGGL